MRWAFTWRRQVSGRTAVVIGAGGFLGSHLSRRLLGEGWRVTGVVRSVTAPHVVERLRLIQDEIELVEGDAGDEDLLAIVLAGADVVFPLAGHSGAAHSIQVPIRDLEENAKAQLTLLEVIRHRCPDVRAVFPGSRLEYGRPEHLPVEEAHPLRPTSVYGIHKMTAEHYYRLYHDLFGLQTCRLRISNPYGPCQSRADRAFGIIGTFLAAAAAGDPIRLYGGGASLREFIYVDDLTAALLLAGTHPAAVGNVYNVSGDEPMSLRQAATEVIEVVGRGSIVDVPWPELDAAIETGSYVGDTTAIASLGWRAATTMRDGLARTWSALAAGEV
jgi:nucleoside-diphosphate-sugar epimerase